MPIKITQTGLTQKNPNQSTGAPLGMNLLTAKELQDQRNAQLIQGYFQKSNGKLITIDGILKIVETLTGESPTMFEYWVDDIWVVGYSDKVATYQVDSDTFTVQDTLSSTENMEGKSWGDIFYYTNGSTVIKYLTFDFGSELLTLGGWVQSGGSELWTIDVAGTRLTSNGVIGTNDATFDFSASVGIKYKLEYQVTDNSAGTGSFELRGPFNDIDLRTAPAGINQLIFTAKNTNDLEVFYNDNTGDTAQVSSLSLKQQDRNSIQVGSLSNSPFCKHLEIADSRLIVGGIIGDEGRFRLSNQDTGEVVPFQVWEPTSTPPLPTDANSRNYAQAGSINSISRNPSNNGGPEQIVVHFDKGQVGFTIQIKDSYGVGLSQDIVTQFEKLGLGGTKSFRSTVGLVYTNSAGAWIMKGQSGESDNFLKDLGDEFISKLNFDDADIIEDEINNRIIITCKEESSFNNLVIFWDYIQGNIQIKRGWNLSRIMLYNNEFYASDSLNGNIYKMFEGSEDNGISQFREFQYEVNLGQGIEIDALYTLEQTIIKGFFSLDSIVEFNYDIYDKNGIKFIDVLKDGWEKITVKDIAGNAKGIGELPIGGSIGGQNTVNSLIETRFGKRTNIREFSRLILKIRSEDVVQHEITWIQSKTRRKSSNTTNG